VVLEDGEGLLADAVGGGDQPAQPPGGDEGGLEAPSWWQTSTHSPAPVSWSSVIPMRESERLPRVVAHADWGVGAAKRWVAVALLGQDGCYRALAPRRVGRDGSVLRRLGVPGADPRGGVVLGFDFPIGLPRRYAELVGVGDFRPALAGFGQGRWEAFYEVASAREQIGLYRPFYPMRPGGRAKSHLYEALGLGAGELLRRCDRQGAEALFWTLGGKQVGKAAIDGWRTILVPALRDPALGVALWPFDGDLAELVARRAMVVAETWPRECYRHLGLFAHVAGAPRPSKRRQADRERNAPALFAWAAATGTELDPELAASITDGFGSGPGGEDPFDAVAGLFGMLNVLLGRRPAGVPTEDEAVRRVEGWILGLAPSAG
jgi:hypothetical protein